MFGVGDYIALGAFFLICWAWLWVHNERIDRLERWYNEEHDDE